MRLHTDVQQWLVECVDRFRDDLLASGMTKILIEHDEQHVAVVLVVGLHVVHCEGVCEADVW